MADHRVVIVGGGFGGVRAALKLANRHGIAVKLITSQSFFEYHAALYRSATGRSPLEVAIPLQDFFEYAGNVEVLIDKVTGLQADDHIITGQSGSRYQYDSLILALGNVTEYYGIAGLQELSYGVKSIHEALKLKRHLHQQLIDKQVESKYVVIGAGATGVELAAEMASYLRAVRRRHKVNKRFSVELIEAGPRPVAAMPAGYSRIVQRRLHRLGVKLHLNTNVTAETADGIELPGGLLTTHTVVWTAGVSNNPFFANHPQQFQLGKNRRVHVDQHLMASPDIYVIGDSADTPYSGMAQTALHDASFAADNILRRLHRRRAVDYRPKKPIYAIPVGARWAAVLWGKRTITGRPGWVLRRLADLRLYLNFLPLHKALTTWRYGFVDEEICPICRT